MAVIKIYLSEDGTNYVSKFPNSTKEFSSICEKGHYQIPLGWSFGGTHKTNTFQCRLSGTPYYINEFEKYKHIKVTKNGTIVFLGSNPNFKKTIEKADYYEVTATYEDYSRKFSDVLFSSDPTWEKMVLTSDGWTVCNPSDISHSLVHYLFSCLNTDSSFTLHCTYTDSTPVSYAYFKYNNKVLDKWDKCLSQNALAYYVVNRDVYVFDIMEQISGTATTIPNIESEATVNEKPYVDHTLPAIRRPTLIQNYPSGTETRVYDSGTITLNDGGLISGSTEYNGTMQAGAVKVGDNQEVKAMRNLRWHFSGSHSNNPKFKVQTGAPYETTSFWGLKIIKTPYSSSYTEYASGSAYDETLKFILTNDNIAFDRSASVWMTANVDVLDYNALTKPFDETEWNGKEEKCEFIYASTNADVPEQNALRYLNALRYASKMEAKKYNFYSDLDLALNTICVIQNVTTADEIANHEYIRITDKVDNLDDFGGYTYTGVPYVSEQVVADSFFNPVVFDEKSISKDFNFYADRTTVLVNDSGTALPNQPTVFTISLKEYYAVPTLTVGGVTQTLVRRTNTETSGGTSVTEYMNIWDCTYMPSGQIWGSDNGQNLVAVATLDEYSKRLDIGTSVFTPTVASVTYSYAITADTTTPSSFPYDTPQNVTESTPYLWQKATVTKTDGNTSDSIALIGVFIKGDQGETGTGVTISSTSIKYQGSSSGTVAPTGTWSDSPTVTAGTYLWTRTTVTYSDGNITVSYSVAYQGQDGHNGTDGTSVSITSTSVQYQASASGTSTPTGTWSDSIPQTAGGNYLWTRTIVNYSDGNSTTSYSVSYLAVDGANALVFSISPKSQTFVMNKRLSTSVTYEFTVSLQGYTGAFSAPTAVGNSSGSLTVTLSSGVYQFSLPYNNSDSVITISCTHPQAGTVQVYMSCIDETEYAHDYGLLSTAPTSSSTPIPIYVAGKPLDYYTNSTDGSTYDYGAGGWVASTNGARLLSGLNLLIDNNIDLSSISNANTVAFFKTIISDEQFVNALFALKITLGTGGLIKGGTRYNDSGSVAYWAQDGFWFSADGRLKANLQSDDNYNTFVGTGVATTNSLAGNYNTAFGYETMNKVASGAGYNVSMGYRSLYSLTTGDYNVAIGYQALYSEQAGSYNTAIGYRALYSNHASNKGHNTAIGVNAMYSTISGMNNVAIGESALYLGLYADKNVAVGLGALYRTSNGAENVAIGYQAMLDNVGGNYNIGIGTQALYSSSGGNYNIGIGWNALAYGRGSNNIGIGFNSLNTITTGKYNIGIGFSVTEQASAGGYYQMNINDSLIYREYSNTRTASEIAINLGKYYSSSVGARTVGAMGVFDGKAVTYIRFETSSQVKIGTTSGEYSLNYGGNGSTTYSGRTMLLFINPSIAGGGRLDCLEPEETSGGAGEPT